MVSGWFICYATADVTRDRAQVVTWAVESSCNYRWSFTPLPTTHLLLCGPVPNRPRMGTSLWVWELETPALYYSGPSFYFIFCFLLYNIVLVLPYINMNPPWVYTCSQSWTLLPPPSPYHPSGSSQCTSPKLPISCIEPGLAICFLYDIIHVLMPFSQIIPLSLSLTESKRLFYTSVSLLLSRIQGCC